MIEVLKNLYSNPLIGGAITMGIIGAIIVSLKSVPEKIFARIKRHIVYSVHIDETDELYLYVERWLKHNHDNQYRNMSASLHEKTSFGEGKLEQIKSDTKKDTVFYKQFSDFIIIRHNKKWITIYKGRDKIENANSFSSMFFNSYTISMFFKKQTLTSLIDEVVEFNQRFKPNNNMISICAADSYGNWIEIRNIKPKKIENIFLNDTIKDNLISDVDRFVISKKWYAERAIPYKRGYCFYGEPGNGKTSLALAIAKHLNRNINILTLQSLKDSELQRTFRELSANSILLIEDIDAIFDKRESKVKDLTFSTLLQCLDGVFYTDNVILIITTNHIDHLDEALLRDGRIDVKVEINNPTLSVVVNYVNKFYDTNVDFNLNDDANHVVGISMSKVQNICLKNSTAQNAFKEITSNELVLNRI